MSLAEFGSWRRAKSRQPKLLPNILSTLEGGTLTMLTMMMMMMTTMMMTMMTLTMLMVMMVICGDF